jgi:hypothetical protein
MLKRSVCDGVEGGKLRDALGVGMFEAMTVAARQQISPSLLRASRRAGGWRLGAETRPGRLRLC